MIKLLIPLLQPAALTPVTEIGVLPTWALILIVIGAATIAGVVFWFIKKG